MMSLRRYLINNLVLMSEKNTDPAVDKVRSQIDDGRAELTLATGQSGIMRGTLAASMGLLLLAGCGPKGQAQEAQRPVPAVSSAEVKPTFVADKDGQMKPTPASTTEEVAFIRPEVAKALKNVPEAEPYIDEMGRFDYRAARVDLGMAEAKALRNAWNTAISVARANA
ncbi:MAG: hypothetical protein COA91_02060 [Robiginitomaculum sp.]|nr:MAG: hypothetical protein COA91_02060 [Robiginitomaculum sp.]